MVRLGGRWYLFYSGGSYRNNSYGVAHIGANGAPVATFLRMVE